MKALAPLLAVGLLTACTAPTRPTGELPSESPNGGAAPLAPPASPSHPAPATLAGEWKVVAIDGQELREHDGFALSANASEIWWAPRCAGMVRGYSISGNAIQIGRAPSLGPPPTPGSPPPPVCAIGLPQRLSDAVRALDAATEIRRTPSNGVELTGGGHSLLLFSQ